MGSACAAGSSSPGDVGGAAQALFGTNCVIDSDCTLLSRAGTSGSVETPLRCLQQRCGIEPREERMDLRERQQAERALLMERQKQEQRDLKQRQQDENEDLMRRQRDDDYARRHAHDDAGACGCDLDCPAQQVRCYDGSLQWSRGTCSGARCTYRTECLERAETVVVVGVDREARPSLPASPCYPNPCGNGGQCRPIGYDDFTCECPRGYEGRTCQRLTCNPNYCSNGGVCSESTSGGTVARLSCACPYSYGGAHCESRL